MFECPRGELRDRLPDYVNGTLSAKARGEVETHLATCDACRADVILIKAARGAMVRRTPAVDVARIAAAVRTAGVPVQSAAGPRARPLPTSVWKVAAAAMLVAGAVYAGYLVRGPGSQASTPTVAVDPAPAPKVPAPAVPPPTRLPRQLAQLPRGETTSAVAPPAPPKPMARRIGLTFGGVEELTPAQAAAIMKALDGSAGTLDAEPEGDIALETAS